MRNLALPTLLLLLLIGAAALPAQDAVFSQFYAAPLRLNPALAGVGSAPRVTLNYRSQHTTYPSAFVTMAAGYEQPIEGTNSTIGLRLATDRQLEGTYTNTDLAAIYVYEVRLSRSGAYARLGLSAGTFGSRLDYDRLVFGDIIDPLNGADGQTREALASTTKTDFDFGAGVLFYMGNAYGGVAVEHLNRPNESLIELNENLYAGRPQRLTIHGGAQYSVSQFGNPRNPVYVAPNFLFVGQAEFKQLNLGSYFGYGDYALGVWYRHAFENPDGFIGAVSFRKDVVRIGISYDAVYSGIRTLPGGVGSTLEVSLGIDFGDSKKLQQRRWRDRFNDCLGMFR